ncbi:unnamed protein product, partial [marine sediment metagenome]
MMRVFRIYRSVIRNDRIINVKKGNNTDIEIDFVLDIPEERVSIPIECKVALKLYDRHFKNLIH